MKIKLAALAALCLTVCLICPAQAVSSPPADPAADTPRTGDTFCPAVWLGALTVSAGMTAGLLRRKRS